MLFTWLQILLSWKTQCRWAVIGRSFVRIGRCPAPVTKPGVNSEQGICRCALVSVEAFQVIGKVSNLLTGTLIVYIAVGP